MLGEKLFLILLPIFLWLLFFPIFIGKRALKSVPSNRRSKTLRNFWLKVIGSSIVFELLFNFIYSLVVVPSSLPIFEGILKSGFLIGAVVGLVYALISNEPQSEHN